MPLNRYLFYSFWLHFAFFAVLVSIPRLGSRPSWTYYGVDLVTGVRNAGGVRSGAVTSPVEVPSERKSAESPPVTPVKVKRAEEAEETPSPRLKSESILLRRKALRKRMLTPSKSEPQVSQVARGKAQGTGEGAGVGSGMGPGSREGVPGAGAAIVAEYGAGAFPYPWYLELIRDRLDRNWSPPTEFRSDASCQAVLTIEKHGTVRDAKIEKVSGDDFFDQLALRAVIYASPLPPLPTGLGEERLRVHIRFVGKR